MSEVIVADELAASCVAPLLECEEELPIFDTGGELALVKPVPVRLVGAVPPFKNCDNADESSIVSEPDDDNNSELPVGSCNTSEAEPDSPEKA